MSSLLLKDPLLFFAQLNDGREILLCDNSIPNSAYLKRYAAAIEQTLELSKSDIDEINDQIEAERLSAIAKLKQPREKTRRHNQAQFAYIMINKRNGYYKIGISQKPSYRERTLQSQEPEIELIYVSSGNYGWEEEMMVHAHFREKRMRGEWFNLTIADVEKAKEMLS